ncbi:MAG TPA: rubredoxin [Candidatus Humimicrobiaceae bacterium]|jgi:rubredoxin
MVDWKCTDCGYIFDVKVENPEFGLEPPYEFENLPEDWTCPVCGASKSEFKVCKLEKP